MATNKQPVKNVAIFGAGGNVGKFIAEELIKGGKHKVTAITRPDSKSKLPEGIHDVKKVNYDDHSALVEALKGQEALVLTISVFAPPEWQNHIVDAAVEAGVRWYIPNEWGFDLNNKKVGEDTGLGPRLWNMRKYIEDKAAGKMHWIGVACGFWYEFSLAGTEARYGFDFEKKEVTFFDDGKTMMSTSTWPQVGRGVAALLSLPESTDDGSPSLGQYKERAVFVSSFHVNQKDMFESVLRVTGDKEADWKITYEGAEERFNRAKKMLDGGNILGMVIMLYTRVMYNDWSGSFNDRLDNDVLDLPQEDFDQATKVAVDMAARGETNIRFQ